MDKPDLYAHYDFEEIVSYIEKKYKTEGDIFTLVDEMLDNMEYYVAGNQLGIFTLFEDDFKQEINKELVGLLRKEFKEIPYVFYFA